MEKPTTDEKQPQGQKFDNEKKDKVESPDSFLHTEKIDSEESQHRFDYDEEEDSDIKIVNELAAVEDDPSMPVFTVRSLLVGAVSTNTRMRHGYNV